MYLKGITYSDFKNLEENRVIFSNKFNWLTGNNGSGKTNLMDAVYYLSMARSYFSVSDNYSINYNSESAFLGGEFKLDNQEGIDVISIGLSKSQEKVVKRNSKQYPRLSDHIGNFPVVMISPADISLINDSGEERRRLLNSVISQIDREYLRRVQKYNHLLLQRNKLLKESNINHELISVIDEQMSAHANYIFNSRKSFVEAFVPETFKYYASISNQEEVIDIEYKSDLQNSDLVEIFKSNFVQDQFLKHTSAGIHRDDLVFKLNGHPIKRVGSQGQQKTFLLSLKLAQFNIMRSVYGKPPILLLDDIFDKLDMNRVEYLINLVGGDNFGQVFISDSNKIRATSMIKNISGEFKIFEIQQGKIIEASL